MNVTRQALKDLYDQSPIPIYERHMVKWEGVYKTNHDRTSCIVISSSLPLYRKAEVFLHELGHHYCSATHCICCCKNNHVLNEVHAIAFGLRKCLDYGFIRSHCRSVWFILRILDCPEHYGNHYCNGIYLAAAKKIVKRKKWNEYLRIFEQSGYSWKY
jgi:hypothetical protein